MFKWLSSESLFTVNWINSIILCGVIKASVVLQSDPCTQWRVSSLKYHRLKRGYIIMTSNKTLRISLTGKVNIAQLPKSKNLMMQLLWLFVLCEPDELVKPSRPCRVIHDAAESMGGNRHLPLLNENWSILWRFSSAPPLARLKIKDTDSMSIHDRHHMLRLWAYKHQTWDHRSWWYL